MGDPDPPSHLRRQAGKWFHVRLGSFGNLPVLHLGRIKFHGLPVPWFVYALVLSSCTCAHLIKIEIYFQPPFLATHTTPPRGLAVPMPPILMV